MLFRALNALPASQMLYDPAKDPLWPEIKVCFACACRGSRALCVPSRVVVVPPRARPRLRARGSCRATV
jgi:hypothetical protein